jgi:hypothetical protein
MEIMFIAAALWIDATLTYGFATAKTLPVDTYHTLNLAGYWDNPSTVSLGGTTIIEGDLTIYTYATLDTTTNNYGITLSGNMNINSNGLLNANGSTITVGGNWTNNGGTFNAGSGTVTFNNNALVSTISGNTTFFNLRCVTPDKQLTFTQGSTQRVDGLLTLTGTAGHLIVLRSSVNGNYFYINDQGTESVTFVDVKDSSATNSITAANSKDSNHNFNWDFSSAILTWVGTTSTRWDIATNWDLGYIPNSGDSVIIADVTNDPVLYGNTTVNNLTINNNGVLDINGNNLTVNGTFSNLGTLKLRGNEAIQYTNDTDSGIVEYYGSGSYANTLAAGSNYYTLSFTGSGSWTLPANLYITGDFNHTSGIVNHNNGTVTFNGTNQSIRGSTIFNNLIKSTPGSLSFEAGSNTSVLGSFSVSGSSNTPLTLQSTISGTYWNIDINNYSVNYLNVFDSRVTNKTIYSLTCTYNHTIGWDKIPPGLENQINNSTNVVDRLDIDIQSNMRKDFMNSTLRNINRRIEYINHMADEFKVRLERFGNGFSLVYDNGSALNRVA